MIAQLKWNNTIFLPSLYGTQKNYCLNLDLKELEEIRDKAYSKKPLVCSAANMLLQKTLHSGVCSGLSALSILNYAGKEVEDKDIEIMQCRVWGRPFIMQSIKSYFEPQVELLNKVIRGLETSSINHIPLIVFLPKVFKLNKINYAHTVVPYYAKEGLSKIQIRVYDSNYPGNDDIILMIDKINSYWQYKDRKMEDWVLTLNYLGNLLIKVPFLI